MSHSLPCHKEEQGSNININSVMGLKRELIRLKNRIRYEDAKIRLNVHRKKTPMPAGLSALPVNRLPFTLREEVDFATYTQNMLTEAGNTGDILNQSLECVCDCHSNNHSNTLVFHSGDCLQNCGKDNNQYCHYLSNKLRTLPG